VTAQHPDARIPAQDRLVIPAWTHAFGLFVPGHRFSKPLRRDLRRAERASMELRAGAALADDPGVVRSLVLVRDARQHFARAVHPVRHLFAELIRDREQQRDQRLLIRRIDLEDVEADALRR
jgi:hypothetical protein